jgi:glyoxylase-like metal-dependent hydrolase (beta-lactamase superfamily II)
MRRTSLLVGAAPAALASSIALFGLALFGCASLGSQHAEPTQGGIVHRYTQGRGGGYANIYWYETPAGPVMIDVPLSLGETKKLRGSMVRPYRIYITAARPERFGGLPVLRQADVPAFSTPAVATEIKEHGAQRLGPFHRERPEDVPEQVEAPSPTVDERTHAMVGEIELDLLPLGPAESESSLALFLPKTGELIAGDVVGGHEHLDLTWGRSAPWQERLTELKALEPRVVYPGHGTPGGPELIDESLVYLKFFHDVVAEKVKPGAPARITKADAQDIKRRMLAQYPKLGRPELLDKSIPAEYAVQVKALPPPPAEAAKTAQGAATPGPAGSTPAAASAPAATPAPAAAKPAESSSGVDDLLGGDSGGGKKKKKKK